METCPVVIRARGDEIAVHRPVVVFAEGAGHWWGDRCGFRKKGIKCAAAFKCFICDEKNGSMNDEFWIFDF